MLRRLLPLLLALLGLAGGTAAGILMRPDTPAEATEAEAPEADVAAAESPATDAPAASGQATGAADYVRLNNQFVVPVVTDARVSALVILSLNLEVDPGTTETVYAMEPKLRDAFLQVLFDHANAGGFDGAFTAPTKRDALRGALRETATGILGDILRDVLIIDMVRQDS